ncbi:hypothetical protein QBC45DRAFT_201775 [Copromyces sp. CBS 386.78]|nr:hypothetical protein QBC45DRAFT_201775 [Copromyces sp. CBS 386.78]
MATKSAHGFGGVMKMAIGAWLVMVVAAIDCLPVVYLLLAFGYPRLFICIMIIWMTLFVFVIVSYQTSSELNERRFIVSVHRYGGGWHLMFWCFDINTIHPTP